MEQEFKSDQDLKTLATFEFKADLPMAALFISDSELNATVKDSSNLVEVRKSDSRANDGKKRVRLTASSDATDLVGDVMTKNALTQMKNTAPNTTIFLNHEPVVPESVFGSVEKAELNNRIYEAVDSRTGKTVSLNLICLDYDIVVEETNPRAMKTYEMIEGGNVKLGASVTIAIIDRTTLKDGRRAIEDVIYLETSIVGIPCNQTAWVKWVKSKSWVHQARKSLRSFDDNEENNTIPIVSNDGLGVSSPVDIDSLLSSSFKEALEIEGVTVTKDESEDLSKTVEADPVPLSILEQIREKDAIGSTGLPIAARDMAWSASDAKKAVQKWAGAEDKPNAKYARAFFYKVAGGGDKFSDFKLPFATVVDDRLTAVPKGVFAVAGALSGSRAGVDMPDGDKSRIKSRVESYYARFRTQFKDTDIIVPWKKESKDMKISSAKNVAEILKAVKDLFTDNVEEHFEDPWLYLSILGNSMVELIYFNSSMPADEKVAAAGEMFDAFKMKMLEVLHEYFTEDEETEKSAFVKSFNDAAAIVMAKSGSRHNSDDRKTIQKAHDMMNDLGAECSEDSLAKDIRDAFKTFKASNGAAEITNAAQAQTDTESVTALQSELDASKANGTELEGKLAQLEKDNKKLSMQVGKWKAAANVATQLLESHLDSPAGELAQLSVPA